MVEAITFGLVLLVVIWLLSVLFIVFYWWVGWDTARQKRPGWYILTRILPILGFIWLFFRKRRK